MIFCPVCSTRLNEKDKICPECGSHIYFDNDLFEEEESFELRPRFVFIYELLPSSLQTTWILFLTFVAAILIRDYFHLQPKVIIAFFILLLLLKDFQIFYRKFCYRNVKYIISNKGIEYSNMSKDITYFIPYEDMVDVRIQRNLATMLFGYGHILVRNRDNGIYLDYIANVEQVYDYICQHVKH